MDVKFINSGLRLSFVLLLMLAFRAWAADPAPPKDVAGRAWVLVQLNGEEADATIRSTVEFAPDSRASGTTGCNRWFGTAMFDGSSLVFSGVGATRMACPQAAMDREAAFTRMLGQVRSWKIAKERLALSGEEGAPLAVFRPEAPSKGRR